MIKRRTYLQSPATVNSIRKPYLSAPYNNLSSKHLLLWIGLFGGLYTLVGGLSMGNSAFTGITYLFHLWGYTAQAIQALTYHHLSPFLYTMSFDDFTRQFLNLFVAQ